MKIESKLNKIYAIVIATLFIAMAISSVFAVRTITNTGDNVDTFIRNSNGHYWTATGANMQLAINDLGNGGGTVWCGSNITLTSALHIRNGTTLDFCNKIVTLNGVISFINMTGGNWNNYIQHVNIKPEKGSHASIILLYLPSDEGWHDRIRDNTFRDINIENTSTGESVMNYTGIHLHIDSDHIDAADQGSILWNVFENVKMINPEKGIVLQVGASDAWGNGNTFENIWITDYIIGIEFRDGATFGSRFNRNVFNNIKFQTDAVTRWGIANISGIGNSFNDIMVWDLDAAVAPVFQINLNRSANNTRIWCGSIELEYYKDLGNRTDFRSANKGNEGGIRLPYTYIIYKNATKVFVQNGTTGQVCFKSNTFVDAVNMIFDFVAMGSPNSTDSSPSTVFIQKGTYPIATTTYVGGDPQMHDITFIGEDKHSVILQAAAGATLASGFFYVGENIGTQNVTFRNICFDGNSADARGIYLDYDTSKWGVTIEDCVFKEFDGGAAWSTGIYGGSLSTDTVYNIVVRNNDFFECDFGIEISGDADPSRVKWCDISGNYFGRGGYENIRLNYANNCTITNNRITTGTYGIRIANTYNCTVIGNIIVSTNGIVELTAANDNIIMGNNLRMCTTPITRLGATTIITNNIPIGSTGFQLPISAPTTPVAGSMYVNATTGDIAVYSGAAWIWTHG